MAFADGQISSRLNITTTDGSVSNWPYQLKVTTGTLTDNGDGTMTLQTGGGSGGGSSISTCGSSPVGIQFTDADSCTWCTTVATTGNLVTTLESCPTPATPNRNCTPGESIGLLLSLVCG